MKPEPGPVDPRLVAWSFGIMWVGGMLIATGILLVNTLHRHQSWGSFAIFEVLMLVVVTLFVVAMYSILWMSQGSPPHAGLSRRK